MNEKELGQQKRIVADAMAEVAELEEEIEVGGVSTIDFCFTFFFSLVLSVSLLSFPWLPSLSSFSSSVCLCVLVSWSSDY